MTSIIDIYFEKFPPSPKQYRPSEVLGSHMPIVHHHQKDIWDGVDKHKASVIIVPRRWGKDIFLLDKAMSYKRSVILTSTTAETQGMSDQLIEISSYIDGLHTIRLGSSHIQIYSGDNVKNDIKIIPFPSMDSPTRLNLKDIDFLGMNEADSMHNSATPLGVERVRDIILNDVKHVIAVATPYRIDRGIIRPNTMMRTMAMSQRCEVFHHQESLAFDPVTAIYTEEAVRTCMFAEYINHEGMDNND